VMSRSRVQPVPTQVNATDAIYNGQQLKQAVDQAVKQERERAAASIAATRTPQEVIKEDPKPIQVRVTRPVNRTTQWGRGSLSKSEREQLAADLRLLSTSDDESLSLIGEKINQEF